jgi:hypothetical protein
MASRVHLPKRSWPGQHGALPVVGSLQTVADAASDYATGGALSNTKRREARESLTSIYGARNPSRARVPRKGRLIYLFCAGHAGPIPLGRSTYIVSKEPLRRRCDRRCCIAITSIAVAVIGVRTGSGI